MQENHPAKFLFVLIPRNPSTLFTVPLRRIDNPHCSQEISNGMKDIGFSLKRIVESGCIDKYHGPAVDHEGLGKLCF